MRARSRAGPSSIAGHLVRILQQYGGLPIRSIVEAISESRLGKYNKLAAAVPGSARVHNCRSCSTAPVVRSSARRAMHRSSNESPTATDGGVWRLGCLSPLSGKCSSTACLNKFYCRMSFLRGSRSCVFNFYPLPCPEEMRGPSTFRWM